MSLMPFSKEAFTLPLVTFHFWYKPVIFFVVFFPLQAHILKNTPEHEMILPSTIHYYHGNHRKHQYNVQQWLRR